MKLILLVFLFITTCNFAQVNKEYSIDSIDEQKLEEIISNRNNKNLLVNIWASWCVPCREEFPDLVKLYDIHKNSLDIVAITVDYKEEINDKVIPFLTQMNISFPVFISDFKKDEQLIKFFDESWSGALPGTFIYDKNGNQIMKLEGKQSFESFSSVLKSIAK